MLVVDKPVSAATRSNCKDGVENMKRKRSTRTKNEAKAAARALLSLGKN
jgi:hypothetical protein